MLWIARNKDENLFLYDGMPFRDGEIFMHTECFRAKEIFNNGHMQIDKSLFLEITW